MIPFPIRTLDFGIKGGQKLDEMPIQINNTHNNKSSPDNLARITTLEHALMIAGNFYFKH